MAKRGLVGNFFLLTFNSYNQKTFSNCDLCFLSRLVAFYSVVYLAILLANIHFIRHTKKKVCVVFW